MQSHKYTDEKEKLPLKGKANLEVKNLVGESTDKKQRSLKELHKRYINKLQRERETC